MTKQRRTQYRVKKNPVSKSLYNYLKEYYYYENIDWTNPTTGEVFSKSEIKNALDIIKGLNPIVYKLLWTLCTTGGSKSYIARLNGISYQRYNIKSERAMDTLILIIQNPEMIPDEPVVIYK